MRWVAVSIVVLAASSCSSATSTTPDDSVTVFAAASLVEAFTDIGSAFEDEHPGTRVQLNFASSSDLATQISQGAPADVFASADEITIDKIRSTDVSVGESAIFATNSLEILVEKGNPLAIENLADLADSDLIVVTCDTSVPIGRYSAQVLAAAGVDIRPDSFEASVKGIVNKILLGEADAGIVYRSDVVAAGSAATGVPIDPAFNVEARYPVVTIGENPTSTTRSFLDFLLSSPRARAILTTYGFGRP